MELYSIFLIVTLFNFSRPRALHSPNWEATSQPLIQSLLRASASRSDGARPYLWPRRRSHVRRCRGPHFAPLPPSGYPRSAVSGRRRPAVGAPPPLPPNGWARRRGGGRGRGWQVGSGEVEQRLKFKIRNEGVPGLQKLLNFYWRKIKSPRTQYNKN